ncbi:MAG: hypothetical protein CV087_13340 [Candidatus Brocadia sp. WS118]|nr:MAG: hypothetical protein CV087_13340 [Candidatus Brocadia sp. WS118]
MNDDNKEKYLPAEGGIQGIHVNRLLQIVTALGVLNTYQVMARNIEVDWLEILKVQFESEETLCSTWQRH